MPSVAIDSFLFITNEGLSNAHCRQSTYSPTRRENMSRETGREEKEERE